VQSPSTATPQIPGLDVAVGNTQVIVPDKVYASMFKFADGSIAVDGKWTTDRGQSWQRGPAFHSGAYQFPDGEIVQLGFHSKATDRDGYFTVPLLRSTDSRRRAGSSSPARRRLRQGAPPRRVPSLRSGPCGSARSARRRPRAPGNRPERKGQASMGWFCCQKFLLHEPTATPASAGSAAVSTRLSLRSVSSAMFRILQVAGLGVAPGEQGA